MVADPARGMQHGVVLVQEMLRDESGSDDRILYHLRVKVLSNDMRGLGEITVPVDKVRSSDFKQWWARNILPDGKVIELPKTELKEEVVEDAGLGFKRKSVKAALPAVQVGSVIDYGFELRGTYFIGYARIPLQRDLLVRRFRYKWVPYPGYGASYYVRRRPELNVSVTKEDDAILIEASDVPPVEQEPFMPPDDTIRASVITYYWLGYNLPPQQEEFWKAHAVNTEKAVSDFLKKSPRIKASVAALDLAPGAGIAERARSVYGWVQQNIRNTSLLTAEEGELKREADQGKRKHQAYAYMPKNTAESVLERKEATQDQIRRLFIGMMREMGAVAHEVLAPDRSEQLWDERMLIPWQLSETLVFVNARGEPDAKGLFLSPGSGMPFGANEWWVSPSMGLLADSAGGRKIPIPSMPAEENLFATRARTSFPEDGSAVVFAWSGSATGQRGHGERSWLRASSPEDRAQDLERLCGAGGDWEVTKAEVPALADAGSIYQLECEGQRMNLPYDPEAGAIAFEFRGPWIPPVPELTSRQRSYPIVMPYARVDRTSIEVAAPAGFRPAAPPSTITYESGLGRYLLKFTASENGYRVDRTLTMPLVAMKQEAYADLKRFLDNVRVADGTLLEFRRAEAQP